VPRIDTAHVRWVCEQCDSIQVVLEEGTEFSALLAGREVTFVDPCSAADPFSESFWSEVATFFQSSANSDMVLPGGRYACARALVAADLPILAGRSLGEVCHFVQLAVSSRQVLGYLHGQVVPYDRSEAVVKQRRATLQQPAWELKKDALPVANLEQARVCLQAILAAPLGGVATNIPLPNVKRLFRSRFSLELSETTFGHCRLCDLLQDERFRDICALRLQGTSYVIMRPATEEEHCGGASGDPHFAAQQPATSSSPGPMEAHKQPSTWQSSVARTFIHVAPPSPATPPAARRRCCSEPRSQGFSTPSTSGDCSSTASADIAGSPPLQKFCPDDPLSLEEADADEFGIPVTTPSPQYEYEAPYYEPLRQCGAASVVPLAHRQSEADRSPDNRMPQLLSTKPCCDTPLATPPSSYVSSWRKPWGSSPILATVPAQSLLPPTAPAMVVSEMGLGHMAPPSPPPPQAQMGCEGGGAAALFSRLGLPESRVIDAVASGSDSDSECERTPIYPDPSLLDGLEMLHSSEVPAMPSSLTTLSPEYGAAVSWWSAAMAVAADTQQAFMVRPPCTTPSPQHPVTEARCHNVPHLAAAGA